MQYATRSILELFVVFISLAALQPQYTAGAPCNITCQQAQLEGLQELYNKTGGAAGSWINATGWTTASAALGSPPDHCSWFSVQCCGSNDTYQELFPPQHLNCSDAEGVTSLHLPGNGLRGPLPERTLQKLGETLRRIHLQNNVLTGPLAPNIGELLPYAKAINMQNNSLSGTLPASLFDVAPLRQLNLGQNNFSGSLPETISTVATELTSITLPYNQLTGTIPADWGGLQLLMVLNLEHNGLSGTIPPPIVPQAQNRFGNMEVRLRSNNLTGQIPRDIRLLPIRHLDFGENQLTGDGLSCLADLPLLRAFSIDQNKLTGSFPSTIATNDLEFFNIERNDIEGTLPAYIAPLRGLKYLQISNNNKLAGSLPGSSQDWEQLQLLHMENVSMCQNPTKNNSRGEYLPEWLMFQRENGLRTTDYPHLSCFDVVGTHASQFVSISPTYFSMQYCQCASGFTKGDMAAVLAGLPACRPSPARLRREIIIAASVVTVVSLSVLLTVAIIALRRHWSVATANWSKRRGPPALGKSVTLVTSDVEGSTSLWEWNGNVADEAIAIHDRIMRAYLIKYHGYEVATEGDAFSVAFHDPMDAVCWAISVQQALLTADWPPDLLEHDKTKIRVMPDSMLPLVNSDTAIIAEHVMYWGLAARMSIVTGKAASVKPNHTSGRMEYKGALPLRLQSLSECGQGGQVIMDNATFQACINLQHLIAAAVPQSPDFEWLAAALTKKGQHCLTRAQYNLLDMRRARSPHVSLEMPSRSTTRSDSSKLSNWGPSALLGEVAAAVSSSRRTSRTSEQFARPASANGTAAAHPPQQGTSDTVLTSVVSQYLVKAGRGRHAQKHNSGMYLPTDTETLGTRLGRSGRATRNGGQEDMNTFLSRSWRTVAARFKPRRNVVVAENVSPIVFIDMGLHYLRDIDEPANIHQVLVPGLEERARMRPSLEHTDVVLPCYFEAPGAQQAPLMGPTSSLKYRTLADPTEVIMVFSAIDRFTAMQKLRASAADSALNSYRLCVRRLMKRRNGYECQEADGNFMLAFSTPWDAVEFCIMVQEALVETLWDDDVLALPSCAVELDADNEVIFSGPRVRMGIYAGVPIRVIPHTTSGRADYFGPLVNRAARFCHAAAHGGQITAPLQLFERVITKWIKAPCPNLDNLPCAIALTAPLEARPRPSFHAMDAAMTMQSPHHSVSSQGTAGFRNSTKASTSGQSPLSSKQGSKKGLAVLLNTEPSLRTINSTDRRLSIDSNQSVHGLSDSNHRLTLPRIFGNAGPSRTHTHKSSVVHFAPDALGGKHEPRGTRSWLSSMLAGRLKRKASEEDRFGHRQLRLSLTIQDEATHAEARSDPGGVEGLMPYMASVVTRLITDPWQGVHQVEVHHLGTMLFSGVTEPQPVAHIVSEHLAARRFPPLPPSRKATILEPPRGLLASVVVKPVPHRMSIDETTLLSPGSGCNTPGGTLGAYEHTPVVDITASSSQATTQRPPST